jgi:predicted TIM-barrel fold metal-dependent hydrolase
VRNAAILALLGALAAVLVWTACSSRSKARNQSGEITGTALAEFSALEPIDAHTHIGQTSPAFVAMLRRLHMHVLDILFVNDHRPYNVSMEPQRQNALSFIESSAGHAWLCTTFDPFQLNSPNFSRKAIDGLNQDFAHGAVAAKIWKNVGMQIKDTSGQYVMLDDPRFEPIYRDIATQQKTLIIHAGDPDAAWTAQYLTSASASYYAANPDWDMSKRPDAPRKQTILDARDHVVAMNPDLRVIGAHLGSMENDLDGLADRLDRYPNFAVDVAARVERLTREPRDQVRAFFLKYQDRILYGTDLSFDSETRHKELSPDIWELRYAADWRYFSTGDVFDYGDHQVQGLDLPRDVLKKLYHDNAVRWIPGIDTTSH